MVPCAAARQCSRGSTLLRTCHLHLGPEWSMMTSAIAKQRELRLGECILPAACFLFHSGSTHLWLSGARVMWPALEFFMNTLAVVQPSRPRAIWHLSSPTHHHHRLTHSMDLPLPKELHLSGSDASNQPRW
jgi:hypothetical protein